MRYATILIAFCGSVIVSPTIARADETDEASPWSGKVGVAAKYNSNIELTSGEQSDDPLIDEELEDSAICEVNALLVYSSKWDSPWHLDLDLFGTTDINIPTVEDSWVIGKGDVDLGYELGSGSIGLLDEVRYYSEPDDTDFDNLRNAASLVYRHTFSPLWQLRAGLENIVHHYVTNDFLDYINNGVFIEAQNTWRPTFSTYYRYGFQYYLGSYKVFTFDDATGIIGESESDLSGTRHIAEVGFEAFFASRNSLMGSYSFQLDDNSDRDVWGVGVIQGEDDNLEVDTEFNFIKNKGTVLWTHKLDDRFILSLYMELIYKSFFSRSDAVEPADTERTDWLLLSSVWLSARIIDALYAKARYLYRMNESTDELEDFQDHIVSLGLEYKF